MPTPTGNPSAAQVLYTPSTDSKYESTYLLPVLYYGSSIPAAYSSPSSQLSFENSSYYIYSQHNLQSPSNYIEPVTLHGSPGMFLNANNVLASLSSDSFYGGNHYATSTSPPGLNLQSDNVLATSAKGLSGAQQVPGTPYWSGTIPEVMFMSESANNNLFVISEVSGSYYLYRLQMIPQGELNLTGYPPSEVASLSYSTQQAYDSAMQAYWNSVSQLQSYTVYLANVIQLPMTTSYSEGTLGNGPPLALASDYAGDAFVISANYTCTSSIYSSGCHYLGGLGFVLTYISANGIVSTQWITSTPSNLGPDIGGTYMCSGFGTCPSHLSNDQYSISPCSASRCIVQYPLSLAASPTGQYLYLSDPGAPYVYMYSACAGGARCIRIVRHPVLYAI